MWGWQRKQPHLGAGWMDLAQCGRRLESDSLTLLQPYLDAGARCSGRPTSEVGRGEGAKVFN